MNSTVDIIAPEFSDSEHSLLPGISAGFPSPALDFADMRIDLNRHLIKHPEATYFGRVSGQSMKDVGIDDGDLLIIDKSITPSDGKIAVCFINGEYTLKRLKVTSKGVWLVPENAAYSAIKVEEGSEFLVWGVVTNVVKYF